MTQTVAVPLWLLALLAAATILALLEWLLLPGLRWVVRRKVRHVMREIGTRLAIEMPAFKLTRRQALVERLISDPRVLAVAEQHARDTGEPRAAVLQRVERYARETVPAFNAYLYFRLGYWVAKTIANAIYRVRLGSVDADSLAEVDPHSTVVFVMNHRSNMDSSRSSRPSASRSATRWANGRASGRCSR